MDNLSQITIDRLLDEKIIGKRLHALLGSARINNVDQLLTWLNSMGRDSFSRYKNFGQRCNAELDDVINHFNLTIINPGENGEPTPLTRAFAGFERTLQEVYGREIPGSAVLRKIYPHAKDILTVPLMTLSLPRISAQEVPAQERYDTWVLMLSLLEKALECPSIDIFPMLRGHIEEYLHINRERLRKLKWDKLSLTYCSDLIHRQMQEEYEAIIHEYPTRSQNAVMEYFPDYREAMLSYCLDHLEMTELHNCGHKSFADLLSIFEEFYNTSPDIIELSGEDLEVNQTMATYPYLSENGAKFVLSFVQENGRLPLMYLLSRFILTDNNQAVGYLRTVHGIGAGRNTGYNSTGASRYSGEGMTDMLSNQTLDTRMPDISSPEWDFYDFLHLPIIGEESLDYKRLAEDEHLTDFTFNNFLGLLQFLLGGRIFTVRRSKFWMREEMARSFPVRDIIRRLEEEESTERQDVTYMNMSHLFNYNPYRREDNDKLEAIMMLASVLGFTPVADAEPGVMALQPNTLNVSNAIVEILEESDTLPISIYEILARFQEKYPDHSIKNVTKLRPYLKKNDRIVLVNRRYGYALDNCRSRRPGMQTLFDNIEAPEQEEKHITVADLKACSPAHDPFKYYEKLIKYRAFIDDNHRLPSQMGGHEERDLKDWRDAVITGLLPATIEEYNDLLRTELRFLEEHQG